MNEAYKAQLCGLKTLLFMQIAGDSFKLANIACYVGYVYCQKDQYKNAIALLERGIGYLQNYRRSIATI